MHNEDNNKQNVDDTMRDMTKDPKEALKKDYEQTKADMKGMKEKVMNDDEDSNEAGKEEMSQM